MAYRTPEPEEKPEVNPADNPPNYGDADTSKPDQTDTPQPYVPTYQQNNIPDRSSKRIEFEMKPREDDKGPVSDPWFVNNWRPSMAWLYMAVIAFDFILAPLISMIIPYLPFVTKGVAYVPWHPITLEGGGLIHVTFGAVLGITAWGRTKEKTSETSDANGG